MRRDLPPSVAYFMLIEALCLKLRELYPTHDVLVEVNENETPIGVVVRGLGEHGYVRYPLDYENYDLSVKPGHMHLRMKHGASRGGE